MCPFLVGMPPHRGAFPCTQLLPCPRPLILRRSPMQGLYPTHLGYMRSWKGHEHRNACSLEPWEGTYDCQEYLEVIHLMNYLLTQRGMNCEEGRQVNQPWVLVAGSTFVLPATAHFKPKMRITWGLKCVWASSICFEKKMGSGQQQTRSRQYFCTTCN